MPQPVTSQHGWQSEWLPDHDLFCLRLVWLRDFREQPPLHNHNLNQQLPLHYLHTTSASGDQPPFIRPSISTRHTIVMA